MYHTVLWYQMSLGILQHAFTLKLKYICNAKASCFRPSYPGGPLQGVMPGIINVLAEYFNFVPEYNEITRMEFAPYHEDLPLVPNTDAELVG
jgi:hypothetical protein